MVNIRKWFMGVRGRLLILIALPTVVLIITVGTSLYAFSVLRGNLDTIVLVRTPRLVLLSELQKGSHSITQYILQDYLEKNHLEARGEALNQVEEMMGDFSRNLEEIKKYPSSEKFNAQFGLCYDVWKEMKPVLQSVIKLLRVEGPNNNAQLLKLISGKITPLSEKLVGIFEGSQKILKSNTEVLLQATNQTTSSLMVTIIVISLIGGILSIILGTVFATRMVTGLTGLAVSLTGGADKVTSTSVQMNTSSEALSASVTEQAAALQQTAASIEQMSAMVTKNTENSAKSRDISNQSHQSATQGKEVVGQMIQAIEDINVSNTQIMQEVENSNKEISEIIKVIGEIGNKTKVINDIVFQTKLLSFNASVEAARAGEHGKGFAVVAEEVGNLAQMSGNAAREISTMLESSIAKVESIVNNTKTKVERLIVTGKEKVHNGSEIAKRCGEVLDTIVTNVSTVNHMVEEISSASQEQDHGIKEITRAISQLDQVTQQNSVSCQESASAASSLSSEAESLREIIQNLHIAVEGERSAGSAPPHASTGHNSTKGATAVDSKNHHNNISNTGVKNSSLPSGKVIPIGKSKSSPSLGSVSASKSRGSAEPRLAAAKVNPNTAISVPSEDDPRFEDV